MAFLATSSMSLSSKIRAPVCLSSRTRSTVSARRATLRVDAATFWSLVPDTSNSAKGIKPIELNEVKADLSIRSSNIKSDHKDDEVITLDDGTGIHLHFSSNESSDKLEGEAFLFVKDMGSTSDVTIDGKKLSNEKTKLQAGNVLAVGDATRYKVVRDQRAHA